MDERSQKTVVNPWGVLTAFIAGVAFLLLAVLAYADANSGDNSSDTVAPPQMVYVGDGSGNSESSTTSSSSDQNVVDSASVDSSNTDAVVSNGNDAVCDDQHEYFLDPDFTDTISTHPEEGWFIHVQFWVNYEDGAGTDSPEWETVLDPGRYLIHPPDGAVIQGWVWEYGPNCTREVVEAQMADSIERRIDNEINTEGVASQEIVNRYFEKVA